MIKWYVLKETGPYAFNPAINNRLLRGGDVISKGRLDSLGRLEWDLRTSQGGQNRLDLKYLLEIPAPECQVGDVVVDSRSRYFFKINHFTYCFAEDELRAHDSDDDAVYCPVSKIEMPHGLIQFIPDRKLVVDGHTFIENQPLYGRIEAAGQSLINVSYDKASANFDLSGCRLGSWFVTKQQIKNPCHELRVDGKYWWAVTENFPRWPHPWQNRGLQKGDVLTKTTFNPKVQGVDYSVRGKKYSLPACKLVQLTPLPFNNDDYVKSTAGYITYVRGFLYKDDKLEFYNGSMSRCNPQDFVKCLPEEVAAIRLLPPCKVKTDDADKVSITQTVVDTSKPNANNDIFQVNWESTIKSLEKTPEPLFVLDSVSPKRGFYTTDARWDIVSRAMRIMEEGCKKKFSTSPTPGSELDTWNKYWRSQEVPNWAYALGSAIAAAVASLPFLV